MRPSALLLLALTATACSSPRSRPVDAAPDEHQNTLDARPDQIEPDADESDKSKPKSACGVGGTVGFPGTEFRPPVVQCHWGDGINVMVTTMVMDVDGDGKPEILFSGSDQKFHAISGTDCTPLWEVPFGHADGTYDLAVADLDGDGTVEVVGNGRVGWSWDPTAGKAVVTPTWFVVFDGKTGAVRAELEVPEVVWGQWEPLAIANVDGVGNPEILLGNAALRFEDGKLSVAWEGEPSVVGSGIQWSAAAADFDGDGVMEVVDGQIVYDGATGKTRLKLPQPGFVAVADFDAASPGPEIVHVDARDYGGGLLTVYSGFAAPAPGTALFGPYPTGFRGGAPAVADFDNDGEPEIGVAGGKLYTVYDRECAVTPLPAECEAPGIRWTSRVRDASSGVTTSTVFDFNCDGKAEVVYRDECFLRVYDGETGVVRFATSMSSNTLIEGPVVADTDGSGHAKIVISANDYGKTSFEPCPTEDEHTKTPWGDYKYGVTVLRDPDNRWSPTRRVWNQNAYHVDNVDEKGAVPARETAGWTSHNSYRANTSSP